MANEVEFSLRRQAEAAKGLLAGLRDQGEDDADLIADTIEGETDLLEAIDAALSEMDECEVLITGLKAKEAEFSDRRKKIEDRVDRIKAIVEQAMISTEQLSLRRPTATLTIAKRAPGLIVTNEADIPTKYWIPQERPAPKLDKKAVLAALKEQQAIPGATLDNGSLSLSIRRK